MLVWKERPPGESDFFSGSVEMGSIAGQAEEGMRDPPLPDLQSTYSRSTCRACSHPVSGSRPQAMIRIGVMRIIASSTG